VRQSPGAARNHNAWMPDYPAHLERSGRLADGRSVLIRPIRADDEPGERRFFDRLSEETRRLRFIGLNPVNPALLHFFTHVDYDRHMAFVGEHEGRLVGEARYVAHPGGASCEFGIVVADDWRHSGLARLLMDALTDAARRRGFERIEGLVLRDNPNMLDFVRELGFEIDAEAREPSLLRVVKRLRANVPG
jgi:acetyltransferase